jgi:UDP-N-acetylmuramate--alanine ligase
MGEAKSYFFCGIGGSGMLPLALIVQGRGHEVAGSDRTLDQGRLAQKFEFLKSRGIALHPQDGSGVVGPEQILVTSAAIEETVPDVAKARAVGAERIGRPELLAELFNAAETGIAVGGTSGKSTVTGMIGWILNETKRDPTVMNGAVMKNFVSPDIPFASALVGGGGVFVSEVDESDGSIALYRPAIAVLTNISLDHKSLGELRDLFGGFAAAAGSVVANLDDDETRLLAAALPADRLVTCGFAADEADLFASGLVEAPFGVTFQVNDGRSGASVPVALQVPGLHNAQNALMAIAAAMEAGVSMAEAATALAGFKGLRRRLELAGEAGGVAVIDDFAHNPDKLTATLRTLHAFPGRLLLFFQPHGYGPLRTMKDELVATFAREMAAEDVLIMPDPVYHGGTTIRDVGSNAVVDSVRDLGRHAEHIPTRDGGGERLLDLAQSGDRIIVMGARDDTLSQFAQELVTRLGAQNKAAGTRPAAGTQRKEGAA